MHTQKSRNGGFTFLELLSALLLLSVLIVLAVPQLRGWVVQYRARSALDLVVAEIYRTRMLAVESGGPARLVLQRRSDGCVRAMRVALGTASDERSITRSLDFPGICVRHSGDSVITFNSRGMLRPPTRSMHVSYGSRADSVLLSIAGRVRRNYRRKRISKLLP